MWVYFICCYMYLLYKVFNAFSEKKIHFKMSDLAVAVVIYIVTGAFGLSIGIAGGGMSTDDINVAACIMGFVVYALKTLVFLGACGYLEHYVMGKTEKPLDVFKNKSLVVNILLGVCVIAAGIAGSISEFPVECIPKDLQYIHYYFDDRMLFVSYLIIATVFLFTNVTRESFKIVMKEWKAQDGSFLVGMKILCVVNGAFMKLILFLVWASPWYHSNLLLIQYVVKNEWMYKLKKAFEVLQYDFYKYEMMYILPILTILYVVAVLIKKKVKKVSIGKDLWFGILINAVCFLVDCLGCFLEWICSQ